MIGLRNIQMNIDQTSTTSSIPLSEPVFQGNEWKYVKECLDTGWVSSAGSYVEKFEEEIKKYTGAQHAIACVNGTSALQVSLRLVGVEAGDEVIVPTLTFIATVNAVQYLNAIPVFMDCDQYCNIDVEKVVEFVNKETVFKNGHTYSKSSGNKIAAIVPVHIFGNAVALEELVSLAKERNIKIVEDATESLGTYYCAGALNGRHTGVVGDMGCYSFNGNKIITAGGGGMIVTDNEDYARRARYLITQAKDDKLRSVHNEVGYNFRLSNIQAAVGVAQLEQLPQYILKKKENYGFYKAEIDAIPGLCIADVPSYANNNCWMYPLQIDEQVYSKDRDELLEFFLGSGVQVRPLWHLNHLQKPFLGYQNYKIEKAVELFKKTLHIPCGVGLSREDINRVIQLVRQ